MDEVVSVPIRRDKLPVRGVGWVLRWAATIAVLLFVAAMLTEFGYRVLAEQAMVRAAEAGVREATLPRADRRSIERTIRSRLDAKLGRGTKVVLRPVAASGGSPFSISLTAPADAALPDWLQLVTVWNSQAEVVARVAP